MKPPTIYHDEVSLFLEFEGHAQRFPFTEAGLSRALKLIPSISQAPGYVTGMSNLPAREALKGKIARITVAKGTKRKRETALSPETKAAALDILRKLKL